jgi:dihydrofolate synthase / folylpolyglutamate synthase
MVSAGPIQEGESELMSTRFQTFEDVQAYLEQIPKFSQVGVKAAHFELDHMIGFCSHMGNPQSRLKAVHVAGTNGKGTTCQMLSSVYQEAGYKTGLYTSPHLLEFNERIRVDGETISNSSILEFFQRFETSLSVIPLTYFEISTCMAFWYFNLLDCDISIIETGLGGRLDATNVIHPLVSVITSVSYDHTDLLGDTISKIAKEKAGIIKKRRPVVTGAVTDEAMIEIEKIAVLNEAEVYKADTLDPRWIGGKITLSDPQSGIEVEIDGTGRKIIDRWNVAISKLVTDLLNHELPVKRSEFVNGVESMNQRFSDHAHFRKLSENLDWYFDGAHNYEAIQTLIDQVESMGGKKEPVFFLSLMKDKLNHRMLKNFLPFKNVYYIDTGTERCANCNQILSFIPQAHCYMVDNPELKRIFDGFKSELVIFAGSFYFYSQVNKWMASQLPSDHTSDFKIRQ